MHSYFLQATHVFLGMLPLCYLPLTIKRVNPHINTNGNQRQNCTWSLTWDTFDIFSKVASTGTATVSPAVNLTGLSDVPVGSFITVHIFLMLFCSTKLHGVINLTACCRCFRKSEILQSSKSCITENRKAKLLSGEISFSDKNLRRKNAENICTVMIHLSGHFCSWSIFLD